MWKLPIIVSNEKENKIACGKSPPVFLYGSRGASCTVEAKLSLELSN